MPRSGRKDGLLLILESLQRFALAVPYVARLVVVLVAFETTAWIARVTGWLATTGLHLAPLSAYAQETPVKGSNSKDNRGISWLGQMCHPQTDCAVITDSFSGAKIINTGWLYLTFNPVGCRCAGSVLSDPRPKRIRVDICNSTCFPERGRQCQDYECFAGMTGREATKAVLADDPATYARIDRSIAMAKADMASAAAPVEFFVKACLECSISPDARKKLNEYVASQFPSSVRMVDNPLMGPCLPGYVCERHGPATGDSNTIVDLDGVDYDTIDQPQFWRANADALIALAWKPCANGLRRGSFVPPLQRSQFCTLSDIEGLKQALR